MWGRYGGDVGGDVGGDHTLKATYGIIIKIAKKRHSHSTPLASPTSPT